MPNFKIQQTVSPRYDAYKKNLISDQLRFIINEEVLPPRPQIVPDYNLLSLRSISTSPATNPFEIQIRTAVSTVLSDPKNFEMLQLDQTTKSSQLNKPDKKYKVKKQSATKVMQDKVKSPVK